MAVKTNVAMPPPNTLAQKWVNNDSYLLILACCAGTTVGVTLMSHTASSHVDVLSNKEHRKGGVAQYYADKYPGVESSPRSQPGPNH